MKRYKSTTVREKKNFQRTLNTFSEQYKFISMKETTIGTFNFTFSDSKEHLSNENLVYIKSQVNTNLTNTECLLEANEKMFEHKKYQPYIHEIISSTIKYIKPPENNKNINPIEINYFFKEDAILDYFHHHLEKLSGKELSERFIKKLYTSLQNRVSFPFLYDRTYKSSKTYKIQFDTCISLMIKDYYRDYCEYKWLLDSDTKEDFKYWKQEFQAIENGTQMNDIGIINEWNLYINKLQAEKVEERLFEAIEFLGFHIEKFYTEEPLPDEDFIGVTFDEGLHDFTYDDEHIDGEKLMRFLEIKTSKKHEKISHLGNIHFALKTSIPHDTQLEIFNYFYYDEPKSVFDSQ